MLMRLLRVAQADRGGQNELQEVVSGSLTIIRNRFQFSVSIKN